MRYTASKAELNTPSELNLALERCGGAIIRKEQERMAAWLLKAERQPLEHLTRHGKPYMWFREAMRKRP